MSKPPDETRNDGPVSRTAAPCEAPIAKPKADVFGGFVKDPKQVLGELVNDLQGQWLRHDVLFRALGGEADKLAAQRLGRFVDAVRQAQAELLPAWLDGNELLALTGRGSKEVRSCR